MQEWGSAFFVPVSFPMIWSRYQGEKKKNNSEQIFMHSKALRHRLYQNQTSV
jgi:hypothetical protein